MRVAILADQFFTPTGVGTFTRAFVRAFEAALDGAGEGLPEAFLVHPMEGLSELRRKTGLKVKGLPPRPTR